jgi:hypothetical protein
MKNLMLCSLILLALAMNCGAIEPVQLSGASGQAILLKIADTVQFMDVSGNTGLWNLGGTPIAYVKNQSAQMIPSQITSQQVLAIDYGGWVPII